MSTARYELLKEPELDHPAPRRVSTRRQLVLGLVLLVGGACAIAYATSGAPSRALQALLGDYTAPAPALAQCASGLPPPASPPAPTNPWASLTVAESVAVQDWLAAPARGLNLTHVDRWTLSDNVLYGIEAFRPRKADALAYLADPGTVAPPPRYARATIHHGGAEEPDIRDYLVGPLPIGKNTTMRPLTEIYHRETIPYNARAYITLAEIMPLLARYMNPLAPIMEVRGLRAMAKSTSSFFS